MCYNMLLRCFLLLTITWTIRSQNAPPLSVTTSINSPYVMYKKNAEQLSGNDRFEGFIIDLLARVSQIANFTYILHPSRDGSYGAKNAINGSWNGMVGELVRGEADMAAADLTKTYSRSEAIDFSTAYMHTGITILYKKESGQKIDFLQFLTPFSDAVWLFLVLGQICITFLLWALSHLSPLEREKEELTLVKSLWTVSATFLQQGVDWIPRSVSTRFLLVIWWLFALVIIASYTANLAAFLAVQRAQQQFKNVEELAAQTKIAYGTVKYTSMQSFFEDSKLETYKRMWEYMRTHPSVLVKDAASGVQRVLDGNYAYMGGSAEAEYFVSQHCELMVVGGLMNSESYGFGFPKGSALENEVSKAILFLTDTSHLVELKEKWFSQRDKTEDCPNDGDTTIDSMGLQASIGIFVLLFTGMLLAVLAGVIEWLYAKKMKKQRVMSIDKATAPPSKKSMMQQRPPMFVSRQTLSAKSDY